MGDQLAFLAAAQAQPLPRLGWLFGRPSVNPHRVRLGLEVNRTFPASRPDWYLRVGVLEVDGLIAMHIGHEAATQLVECLQKGRFLAIATVHPDTSEANPALERRFNHLQRLLCLAAVAPRFYWNRRLAATRLVFRPRLRQIQTGIEQAGHLPSAQRRQHANLAIVHLAAIPLPGHAGRRIASNKK
jgi:hypothetical protein